MTTKSRWAWLAGMFPAALVVIVTLALLPDRFKPPAERAPRAGEKAPELTALRPDTAPPLPRPWKVAFELPIDASGAAYALETRAGDRAAIALDCAAAAKAKDLETCQAVIPEAFNGGDVRLVRIIAGSVDWRSEWLTVPPSR